MTVPVMTARMACLIVKEMFLTLTEECSKHEIEIQVVKVETQNSELNKKSSESSPEKPKRYVAYGILKYQKIL